MSRPFLTDEQCCAIAKAYDGESATIDKLVRRYQVRRHNIFTAAQRGGYKSKRVRIEWTPEKDQYLRDHWGKLPPQEIYAHLGCRPSSVFNRLKRINHSTRDNTDFTVYDLEYLIKLDHRVARRFIDDGWLKSYPEYGRNGKTWSRRTTVEWMHEFLRRHPEAINYRAASNYARKALELDRLPDPPRFMRITCRANNWQDGMKATPVGTKYHHGDVQIEPRHHHHTLRSCAAEGGMDFWAPLYETPNCPRCGCKCTRFSEKAVFTDEEPGAGETLNAIAGKLGLVYRGGGFYTTKGNRVTEEELLRFVFSTKRQPGKAFTTFRRLLQAGMTVAPARPVRPGRLMPSLLKFTLRAGAQLEVWDAFLKNGSIGVYWPPGIGKMYFLGTVYASIEGWHELFVHTHTVREQWIAFFREHARNMSVAYVKTPHHWRIDLKDDNGDIRSVVRIFSYATRHDFKDGKPCVVGYDEAQFLPGNRACRLALLESEFRVGLSATPFREDGRADLIQIMTGDPQGEDWAPFKESGQIPDVPVRVILVKDLDQKYRALDRALNGHRTIVFSDAIEAGQRIEAQCGIPFIHAMTKNRLKVLAENKSVCMSRVGDCGIDVQDLEEVIEFNFHHGSRAQSLQRLGRLLHSRKPLRHTVLMTTKEFSLYHKRLTALESKGFGIRIVMYRDVGRRGRPPAPKPVSAWAQLLGVRPAPAPRSPFTESTAQKTARVIRRLDERVTGLHARRAPLAQKTGRGGVNRFTERRAA